MSGPDSAAPREGDSGWVLYDLLSKAGALLDQFPIARTCGSAGVARELVRRGHVEDVSLVRVEGDAPSQEIAVISVGASWTLRRVGTLLLRAEG